LSAQTTKVGNSNLHGSRRPNVTGFSLAPLGCPCDACARMGSRPRLCVDAAPPFNQEERTMRVETIRTAVAVWPAVIFAALAALMASPSEASAAPPRALSIAERARWPLGTRVTVEVTSARRPEAFASQLLRPGLWAPDRYAGIYSACRPTSASRRASTARDGTLADTSPAHLAGRRRSRVAACDAVDPWSREPGHERRGEASEGSCYGQGHHHAWARGRPPYGYKFFVDDGSGDEHLRQPADRIDVATLRPGPRVMVTGLSSQFDDHYEIDPAQRGGRSILD
jgi:hypothetical protein